MSPRFNHREPAKNDRSRNRAAPQIELVRSCVHGVHVYGGKCACGGGISMLLYLVLVLLTGTRQINCIAPISVRYRSSWNYGYAGQHRCACVAAS
jgi:hypothetical protein